MVYLCLVYFVNFWLIVFVWVCGEIRFTLLVAGMLLTHFSLLFVIGCCALVGYDCCLLMI